MQALEALDRATGRAPSAPAGAGELRFVRRPRGLARVVVWSRVRVNRLRHGRPRRVV